MLLDRLGQFAFTELRISPGYVAGAERNPGARAGLAVALEVAQQLRVKAIAGGVASERQWRLVREWGCDFAQGPFISQPLAGDAVPDWIAGWKAPV
jgi:EAL domain-containing protein (putative c-di-GMP-specific phosphodiesterase class I)